MGIYDAQQVVPKLDASGSNFWKWDAAVKLYAQIHDATDILTGVKTRPAYPSYEGLLGEPEPLDVTTLDPTNAIDRATMAARKAFDDNRQSVNDNVERAADRQLEKIRYWGKLDAALKMTFLTTIPREVYEAVQSLATASEQYEEIARRYSDEGLNEACTAWADFFKLCSADCATTVKFTDRFRALLNKLKDMKLELPDKGVVYQFILAIEDSYPEYARVVRRDIRAKGNLTLDSMIKEINDEARRDDPVQTAAFAAKKQQITAYDRNNSGETDISSQKSGGDTRRGRGYRRGGYPSGSRNNSDKGDRSVFAECDQCGREHYGAGPNCWIANPHLATPEWRDRRAAREAAKATKAALSSSAAVALNSQRDHPISFHSDKLPTSRDSFAFSLTAVADSDNDIAQVSEKALRIAGQADYKDRTIVDTGSTNHICIDFDKFVDFQPSTTRSGIRTGAGIVKVKATGTIELFLLQADGKINAVRFTEVLYAPDMFVSIISHSKIRQKGFYYHGWDEKIYRKSDAREIAYTPEINGIPNLLEAKTKREAAEVLALVSAQTPPSVQTSQQQTSPPVQASQQQTPPSFKRRSSGRLHRQ
jgi:hypothetical protein